jgi:serine/threonine protein kinase
MLRSVGRHEIIYPIASGGMASVYAGRLHGMAGFERLVAIKVIHPHLAEEPSFIEMFLDEARLAARIHHPNVGEIFEVGEDDGRFYMLGELVLGQDLKALAAKATGRGKQIPPPLIAHILAEVCAGLEEAHNLKDEYGEPMNLVHRDISTRNILVSYKGFVKLIDFGVAFARGRLSETRDGSAKGKIGYMPPEQLRGEAIDRRADIFALGVVLYTLTVGEHPFPYENEGEQVARILSSEFRRPREASPNIDPALETIILKAMASSRHDRYGSARQLEVALRDYARGTGGGGEASCLCDLMTELFQNEIAFHHSKIREHHGASGAHPPIAQKEKNGSRVTAVLSRSAGSRADRGSSIVRRALTRATKDKRTIRWMTAGVVTLSIVVVALVAGYLRPRAEEAPSRDALSQAGDNRETEQLPAPPSTERPTQVVIELDGLVAESEVYLDGEPVPLPLMVPRSKIPVSLRVRAPGHADFEQSIVPDRDQTIHIAMGRDPPDKPLFRKEKPTRPNRKRKESDLKPPKAKPSLDGWEANPFE